MTDLKKNNNQANAAYLFYKKYFDVLPDVKKLDFKTINDDLEKIRVRELSIPESSKTFKLQTTYPGLLIGSGYIHDANSEFLNEECKDDAYKIGFFFDHISGMPIIPGSSIKGVLRSFFPNKYKGDNVSDNYRDKRYEFIKAIIKFDITNEEIDELEEQIFSGNLADGNRQSVYNRDIFFDAVPVLKENMGKKLFCSDYITPHISGDGKPAPFKNPTPIKFLKVAPQIVYKFSFNLHDLELKSGLNFLAEDKKHLFIRIIEIAGLGAKTNVGYGKFEESEEQKKRSELEKAKEKAEKEKKERELAKKQKAEKEAKEEQKRIEEEHKKEEKKLEQDNLIKENKAKRKAIAKEKGISDLLKIDDIEILLKKTYIWAIAYYDNKKIKEDISMHGKVIPENYKNKFTEHIKSIYEKKKENGRFKKMWKNSYLKALKKLIADFEI